MRSRSPAPTSSPRRSAQGVKPDVFAAANTKLPDDAVRRGPGREAGRLRRQPSSCSRCRRDGAQVDSLDDLARAGRQARDRRRRRPGRRLHARGARPAAAPAQSAGRSSPTCAPNEPDVAGIVGKLTQGAVDAGFVYATDVRGDRRRAEGDRAARRAAAAGRLRRAVVKGAKHPDAGAGVRRRAASTARARTALRTPASRRREP